LWFKPLWMRSTTKLIAGIFLSLALFSCARRGSISGGLKDTIPPVLKMSFPKNYSTDFKGKEIRLTFDEYVKLKDIRKQLIISPPMNQAPEITPLTASREIKIRIFDTLRPNTTYSFNFGQSIEDNNEGNPYPQFKYVFSTGSYIDSLSLGGVIKDAYDKEPEKYVSVMLYEADEKFNDSIIYKENPRYVSNTLDSLKTFTLENLKPGKYLLVAMKDYNSNFRFDPKKDKIAFHKKYITIPNDTLYEMELFREKLPFKAFKPAQASGNRLIMGYEGDAKDVRAELRDVTGILPTVITKFPQKDSINIWFKPVKSDSLELAITKDGYNEKLIIKHKTQKNDSLNFSTRYTADLPLREQFSITASRPLVKFDNNLIKLIKKDSSSVPFTTVYDDYTAQLKFEFAKEPLEKYTLELLPGALTDFFDVKNDTLSYKFSTKNTSDYGNLRVRLENVRRFPVIVELTNAKGDIVATEYSDKVTEIDFNALEPALYTLRVIYDVNGNKIWDTGSFLEKRQPEEVRYFPTPIDVRANWDVDQTFTLP
jgi:uncharacterized protein (DUF2141 family)